MSAVRTHTTWIADTYASHTHMYHILTVVSHTHSHAAYTHASHNHVHSIHICIAFTQRRRERARDRARGRERESELARGKANGERAYLSDSDRTSNTHAQPRRVYTCVAHPHA